ncbi:MAG: methyltransferase domain-containing protein [Lachnospiraceae bacterium]|nr:methyltransferase domain-containing protein [Lachnospiraceae bacterium]
MDKTKKNKQPVFDRAMKWVKRNTIKAEKGCGIAVTSRRQVIYPEVTGYYIPTLLEWGERGLAKGYAKYLLSVQKLDGSWFDSEDKAPYVFDTAQILKGLLAFREMDARVDGAIQKGCEWILSNMQENGRLATPSEDAWGDDENVCSELIHIYCLSPLREAGRLYGRKDFLDASEKILNYYITNNDEQIRHFSLLSHFYAYVMEGLFDLGQTELCREAMERLEREYQNRKGGIPALKDVPWECSTGMFQLALVWYKLGELDRGNRIFNRACSLQNPSGGWYGSYRAPYPFGWIYAGKIRPKYFRRDEISWANKYFLDALAWKEKLEFERQAPEFLSKIDRSDGRYLLVSRKVEEQIRWKWGGIKIADIGCGKGRYIRNLMADYPDGKYYAVDISENVMEDIHGMVEKKMGRMTCIPYGDNMFDLVYACESFEHAVNQRAAFNELFRVTANGGSFLILDKPVEMRGRLRLDEWERWISDQDMKRWADKKGAGLEIIPSVSYENNKNDGLFRAWIVTKG